jgi:hypothetical protein
MSGGDSVTPIRPGSEPDTRADTRQEQLELAGHLMSQAVRAAILLIEEMKEPQVASDVLRLARDRWDGVREARS